MAERIQGNIDFVEILHTPEKTIEYVMKRREESGKAATIWPEMVRGSAPHVELAGIGEEEHWCGGFKVETIRKVVKLLYRWQNAGRIDRFDFGKYFLIPPYEQEGYDQVDYVSVFVTAQPTVAQRIHYELWHPEARK